jgi:fumarate hydratase subunit alpha
MSIRIIQSKRIEQAVKQLAIQAAVSLRLDVLSALKKAWRAENSPLSHKALGVILDNAAIARRKKIPMCQDTGLPVVFVELGQDVHIEGDFTEALQSGIEQGYRSGCLRRSIVADPIVRGSPGVSPAVIHTEIKPGRKVRITVLPKGFGCENKSRLRMFLPTAALGNIKKFVVETVALAGADACPPYLVGVGIGGTADYACLLAKKALLRKIVPSTAGGMRGSATQARKDMERELLKDINRLKIGVMGFGGRVTALAVHIETYPTHIAGLPVAVNLSCHALRSASAVL